MNVIWKGSPNFDKNRKTIDRIVIHWFGSAGSSLASTDAHFQKSGGTSAHYAVEDTTIHQYVEERNVAYHAGNYEVNQRSIGIEHSATTDRMASDSTYQTSGRLIAEIAKRYNIPLDRSHVIRHGEVVSTQCCGTVNIDRLLEIARTITNGTPTMEDNIKRKSYFFDLYWQGLYGTQVDTDKVTKEQVQDRVIEARGEKYRAGQYDLLARKVNFTGDTNTLSHDILFDKITESQDKQIVELQDVIKRLVAEKFELRQKTIAECINKLKLL